MGLSGKPRGVPLPQDVLEMLRGMPRAVNRPFPHTYPHKAWRRVRAGAGLPWVRLHPTKDNAVITAASARGLGLFLRTIGLGIALLLVSWPVGLGLALLLVRQAVFRWL